MEFTSIFLEDDKDDASKAANMVSNVSIAYNASDSTQRNAIYQAQSKIAKAQKQKDITSDRKKAYGLKTEFTSIFL